MADAGSVFTSAQSYATNWTGQADRLMATIQEIAQKSEIKLSPVEVAQVVFDQHYLNVLDNFLYEKRIDVALPSIDSTGLPSSPMLAPVVSTPGAIIPEFDTPAPTINIPDTPTLMLPEAPGRPPEVSYPDIPAAPSIAIPSAPTLASIALPDAPDIELPQFYAELEPVRLAPVSHEFEWAEEPYQSALLDESKAQLLRDLIHGGYGINADDELALWDRARSREAGEAAQQIDEVTAGFAGRGFPIPPGAMLKAIEATRNKLAEASQAASRDIALKRSDLYVQNRQFTVQQVQALESLLLNYHGAVMERMLNAAKHIAEFAIQRFNAEVGRYRLGIERFQAEAQAFEMRLRAMVERANIYRAQLEAAEAAGRLEMQKVEVYRALVDAVRTSVDIYRTQVEAVNIQASIERSKLDAFRATVDAYVASVNAQQATLQVHDARVKGELSKLEAYRAQADVYTARVNGENIRANISATNSKQVLESNAQRLDLYRASLQGFEADLQTQMSKLDAVIKAKGFALDEYRTRLQGGVEVVRAQQSNTEMQVRVADLAARTAIDSARLTVEAARSSKELALSASRAGAEIYGNMIASALSTINAVATVAA